VRADSATFFHHNGNKCAWRRIHAASSGNHAASAGNGANYVSGASPGTARACHKASKRCDELTAGDEG
jgi:hypothetical protein